ncbi:MAG: M20 family metallopeptidase [Ktedonobacteraceae bacterium]|nr:M20 family metallopeptidase [Ktedonobacteraceae bacterium]
MSNSNGEIEQSELWDIARRLISFDTVSASTNVPAAAYLADYLDALSFTVHLVTERVHDVEKAMVVAWAGPAEPGGLILSGHIDVVPFAGQPGWTTDPLTLQSDGQQLFGRGVSDMKVFLAQTLVAAKRSPLKNLKRPLMYIFTCDEEVAGQGSARLVSKFPHLLKGYPLPEVALIGEPTNFEIFPAQKGYATFDIIVHGKGGHSSVPNRGVNAIEKMAEVIWLMQEMNGALQQRISPENRRLFPEYPASSLNCGLISGGLATNMIAETCQLAASVRVSPGDSIEEIVAELREKIENGVAKRLREAVESGNVSLENVQAVPPMRSPLDNAFCRFLSRVVGKSVERGAAFATDGGNFQQLGINSYICGPGLLEQAHQPNESLPVAHFFSGLDYLERVIYEWCIKENQADLSAGSDR